MVWRIEPCGRVKSVAEEDAFPFFGGELGALGGGVVDVSEAAKNAEVGEVGIMMMKSRV
jgi:hypothetical protein